MNQVKLALNICTYKRKQILMRNLDVLKESEFFNSSNIRYYNKLEIFVVDNASELSLEPFSNIHFFHNPNTGGAGGFQRGIEEIRKHKGFSHVIFMDDDVTFEMNSFYLLYDFLEKVDAENADRPVAGRMLDIDNPKVQWTAAEIWNFGDIEHVEFLRDISDSGNPYIPGKVIYDTDADYGGFWFCCYPIGFVNNNDIMPFFIHCDDVEYGLRCGKKPIIIEGVHVWHETYDKKTDPTILYYDTRNSLFVNDLYGLLPDKKSFIKSWMNTITKYHVDGDLISEYMVIKAVNDYLKGIHWLKKTDSELINIRIHNATNNTIKNAIIWRFVYFRLKICRWI